MSDLPERRRAVENAWTRLAAALDSELGTHPRRRGWILALLALAGGLALGMRARRRRDQESTGSS